MISPSDIVTLRWKGKIVSVNRWHGASTRSYSGKKHAFIYETRDFKKFKESLQFAFRQSELYIDKYVDVELLVIMGKRNDTANIEKAIGDTLQTCGYIKDDKYIRNYMILRSYHPVSSPRKRYDDYIRVKIIPLSETEREQIEMEQKNDIYNLLKE